jgi:hypothetical protein
VFDRTVSGSQLKWLSVVDEYTRECLALKVDRGIKQPLFCKCLDDEAGQQASMFR